MTLYKYWQNVSIENKSKFEQTENQILLGIIGYFLISKLHMVVTLIKDKDNK
jgi:hypothetical protein